MQSDSPEANASSTSFYIRARAALQQRIDALQALGTTTEQYFVLGFRTPTQVRGKIAELEGRANQVRETATLHPRGSSQAQVLFHAARRWSEAADRLRSELDAATGTPQAEWTAPSTTRGITDEAAR